PEWARPPSTASADGSEPVSTSPKPGQWVPDASTSSTTSTKRPKPSSTTTSTTTTTTEAPEPSLGSVPSNEIDYPTDCKGDYMPHQDCTKYYRCDHGKPNEFSCQTGLVYHTTSHICDWPSNSDRPECKKG
ncbi:hypothetical protein GWI33_022967, partial [Rhynchophorus ferrugineus]